MGYITQVKGAVNQRCNYFYSTLPDYISLFLSYITFLFTYDKGGGKCVCPRSFVCLSVCLSVC